MYCTQGPVKKTIIARNDPKSHIYYLGIIADGLRSLTSDKPNANDVSSNPIPISSIKVSRHLDLHTIVSFTGQVVICVRDGFPCMYVSHDIAENSLNVGIITILYTIS